MRLKIEQVIQLGAGLRGTVGGIPDKTGKFSFILRVKVIGAPRRGTGRAG